MKKLTNLNGAKALNKEQQKTIHGSGPIAGANCRCFCYNTYGTQVPGSCHSLCPDGTIPGVESGGPSCWAGASY